MRPQRLVMEGFLAYRQRAEIDFADADLFVLSGPTGSGKSSVIDGMIFALYGTIPRLDDRRSVAPVISAQADRARVSFQFSIGDQAYTAVRLVERKGSGATTTEARLLRGEGEEVMAGSADEVTAAVTTLLGLNYDHFIKAVVLPQGAFADFLTDRPKDRQALLRALLDLGLYEQVMQLANLRARSSEAKSESIQESLEKLEVPTEEQRAEAGDRLVSIVEAATELPARVEALEKLEDTVARSAALGETLEQGQATLVGISVPADLDTMVQDRAAALERLDPLVGALAEVTQTRAELDEAIAAHPERQFLETWHERWGRLAGLRSERRGIDLEGLGELVVRAATARDEGRAALDEMRVENAAHELRHGLVSGGTCPVCHTVVSTIPETGSKWDPASLDRLSSRVHDLETAASEARDVMKEAEGRAKQIDQAIAEMEEKLADAPPAEEVEKALEALRKLLAKRAELEEREITARREVEDAQQTLSGLDEGAAALRQALLTARDRVSGEGPPLPGDDVIEGWLGFERWRQEAIARRRLEVEAQSKVIDEARLAVTEAASSLRSWLAGLGVEATDSPRTDLALAIERRQTEVRELDKTLADAAGLEAELEAEKGKARVASALGTHLRANNFERWVLEEAMEVLVEGANELLEDLSGGSYSLKVKDSQFEVVDHRNARLTRTTRSLSGGETFLVALSLALSMAEQLAELTGISSRLESIFLDEGFGSLDQESLDVVAAVLDELVGRGRTVGIVTHVPELADRIPVRFEVIKGPETASIVRVGG
ncbi:MAG: AAA family ATPase [Acidimicrobiia bacterium]